VEEDFRLGKSDAGLGDRQVRCYTALTRHLALAMAALAVCATSAALARSRTGSLARLAAAPDELPPHDPGLIPLTVTEIKRAFNLITRTWQAPGDRARPQRWPERWATGSPWHRQDPAASGNLPDLEAECEDPPDRQRH
jgi:hypothetical protein